MRGHQLSEIIEKPTEVRGWPDFWIVTDQGCFEYTGQVMVRHDRPPEGHRVPIPPEFRSVDIVDVLGDGESAVIVLANGNLVVFELVHVPFGPDVQSSAAMRFVVKEEADPWRDELDDMQPLC